MGWVIFVDKSEDENKPLSFVSILVVEDSKITPLYDNIKDWVKHSRKLGSRKNRYFSDFPSRFVQIKPLIERSRVYSFFRGSKLPSGVFGLIDEYFDEYSLIVVDDKLTKAFYKRYGCKKVLVEGNLTDKRLDKIMQLADNVANYARLKKDSNTVWK